MLKFRRTQAHANLMLPSTSTPCGNVIRCIGHYVPEKGHSLGCWRRLSVAPSSDSELLSIFLKCYYVWLFYMCTLSTSRRRATGPPRADGGQAELPCVAAWQPVYICYQMDAQQQTGH